MYSSQMEIDNDMSSIFICCITLLSTFTGRPTICRLVTDYVELLAASDFHLIGQCNKWCLLMLGVSVLSSFVRSGDVINLYVG